VRESEAQRASRGGRVTLVLEQVGENVGQHSSTSIFVVFRKGSAEGPPQADYARQIDCTKVPSDGQEDVP